MTDNIDNDQLEAGQERQRRKSAKRTAEDLAQVFDSRDRLDRLRNISDEDWQAAVEQGEEASGA